MTEHSALFDRSWQRCWQALGTQPSPNFKQQLLAAWAKPQRHYHNQQHLAECLNHFEDAQTLARHSGEVEIALWFHDAIYELKAKDNEQRSADWAVQALADCGVREAACQRVHALIMATCHAAVPEEADAQLLVDIDLAILGAAPERFAEYDRQVRAEYAWAPGLIYSFKRKQVLQGFLQREHIYSTPHFAQKLEQQARENLRKATA
ncbi:N-methyl-D-aspartate receptor NMDAR2C subunit [Comamonas testosteroni]|uniref:N-methyl-D-aspartate receptor NMDAR2C subunit n=1 Tax=Comamonas testosteroni TaxID=285 RepID=A0A373FM90_COMTE|nr:N-methyl-D-aspartate receptor NMDAR2C subunit [Comamonas testosteroni]RGE45284.1 N-methyl-D-aspartate receptor NMDAR2C subunit [Comamonas testosteroni]